MEEENIDRSCNVFSFWNIELVLDKTDYMYFVMSVF